MKKLCSVVALFFAISLIAGCANIKDDSTRTKTEGTMIGAGAGAVVGGLVGYLVGGEKGALIGAGVGAAAGAAGGYAYGDHVAGQKEKYAKEEDWLDACVVEAKKTNQDLIAYNQTLTQQIADVKKETAALRKKYKNSTALQAKLKERQKSVDEMLASTNTKLEFAKKELEAQKYVADDARKNQKSDYAVTMDSEAEQLKVTVAELEKKTKDLASLSASMSV